MQETFEVIVLIGRPAAGKSEVIDYLKRLDVEARRKRLRIGAFEEIDDFPFVWETFEIDDILSKHGKERVFTTPDYYFKDHFVWNLFIERINLEFAKKLARDTDYLKNTTAIVEFARGGENGFEEAFSYLSDDILKRAGIVYIKVSYEESCRKNRRRFDPKQADSILYHCFLTTRWSYTIKRTIGTSLPPAMTGIFKSGGTLFHSRCSRTNQKSLTSLKNSELRSGILLEGSGPEYRKDHKNSKRAGSQEAGPRTRRPRLNQVTAVWTRQSTWTQAAQKRA